MQQTLQDLFDAMYHGKPSFEDFLNSPMNENYVIAPPTVVGKQTLYKPTAKLKVYQRFLNLFLFEFLPVNDRVVFSYRKGFSAINAVEKHARSKYFFQTDIVAFFQSVDSSLTRKTILDGRGLCPISDLDTHIDRIIEIVCVKDALPVGFPASAPLSNCVLLAFDNEVEKMCSELGLLYSRYADDIIISGQTQESLNGMEHLIQEKLHAFVSKKMNINKGKTKYFQVGGKVKILGMMILPNGRISPDSKKKQELETMLHFYITDRPRFNRIIMETKSQWAKSSNISEDDYPDILSGNLSYVDSIDPEYTDKLRRKFGAVTIDTLIHKGFSSKK